MGGRGFLDPLILGPITGDRSEGHLPLRRRRRAGHLPVERAHAGPEPPRVTLIVPILILLPLYLRLERGHRMRLPLALTLAVLALAEVATFSRSGALGLIVGLLVLAVPYRRLMVSRRLLVPVGALARHLLVVVPSSTRRSSPGLLRARTSLSGRGTQTHFDLYELLPPALDTNPLFGRGLNTFSTYFEFLTGRDNWGPHSYYIALLVGDRDRRRGPLPRLHRLRLPPSRLPARRRPRAGRGGRRDRGARPAAGLGPHGCARGYARRERLLPDHADVLLLRLPAPGRRGAGRVLRR